MACASSDQTAGSRDAGHGNARLFLCLAAVGQRFNKKANNACKDVVRVRVRTSCKRA